MIAEPFLLYQVEVVQDISFCLKSRDFFSHISKNSKPAVLLEFFSKISAGGKFYCLE